MFDHTKCLRNLTKLFDFIKLREFVEPVDILVPKIDTTVNFRSDVL